MRILVVGAGAVGGYFGARLAAAGRDVTFLVRARRAEQLRRDGMQVVSPHGDLTIQPKLIEASQIDGPYDLILLSVKAYTLDSAMADFAPAVGPDTMILPALNGMRHIARLVERFGEKPVLGGACRVVAELNDKGQIVQMADVQSLVYGERNGASDERMQALDAALQGAGFSAESSDGIVQIMWDKWVNLASLGGITCLLGGSIGQVASVSGGVGAASALCNEALAVAAAYGHAPSRQEAERVISSLTNPKSKLTASMYRDMKSGGRVEAEQILGDMVEKAEAKGVEVPLLRAAAVALRVYDAAHNG
ncbi:2-dehydropantoate 2-reductase [Paracoccus thiocyanatus]|uniref:2-dehydropantoate 2-reductase n=1 Tax=Paracoccus thiocyanatus TaxID=34006 RepID=A0A3D8PC91_9RHOB|nr:2-dehydropantoate 2-reductase [Paracoccus thiocyanatus]RDW12881.1 2-dehydropantoate 2-reductase [Paracoccus thiocyanatus]